MPTILFVAGDPSGDIHAAQVARQIKKTHPHWRLVAMGGPALKNIAAVFLADLTKQSVVGIWEPLKKIPVFWHLFRSVLVPFLKKEKPDVVVAVDFFGFNKFVIKKARQAGAHVVYLISPQIWASRPGRIKILKRWVHQMIVIFPFEEKLYQSAGIPVTYVGHPFIDKIGESLPPIRKPSLEPVIGLLPGSRPSEIKRHLPLFLETAERLKNNFHGLRFVLFVSPHVPRTLYNDILHRKAMQQSFLLEMIEDEDYQWRRTLDFAITSSGTATLENALLGIPMVVVYRTSWVTYWLAKQLVRVSRISMVNILSSSPLVPEFIQDQATPKTLATYATTILQDPKRYAELRKNLLDIRSQLGSPGMAIRAAQAITAREIAA